MVETSLVDAIAKQAATHVLCDIDFEGTVVMTWRMQSVPIPGDWIETPHHGVVVVRGREWRGHAYVKVMCEKRGSR